MNVELYHELVEAEVFRLRREVQMLQLEIKVLQNEGKQDIAGIPAHPFPNQNQRKAGAAVASMLGVTDKDFDEAEELAIETFRAPRNLTSEQGYDANGSPVP